jgi:hypothetical protein
VRFEIQTVDAATDFLAVVRIAPDHVLFVARRGMAASRSFAAAAETLTVDERDEMRASLGVPTVAAAPTMGSAYPISDDMTIDDVARYLGCLVGED